MSKPSGAETLPRSSVAVERTWNPESVFPTVEAWEGELEALAAELPTFRAFAGRVGESVETLARVLEERDALLRRLGLVEVYAMLGYAVETTDAAAVARFGRAQAVGAQVQAAIAFVEPELILIGREQLGRWVDDSPALAVYTHYFDDLFRRGAHTRSAEVEEVVGLLADAFSGPFSVYSALVDSDLTFAPVSIAGVDEVAVTQGSIDALLAHADSTVRRAAWESFADGFLSVRNALAANLASAVKQSVFSASVRRYATPLDEALSEPNVPVEVFDALIATFEANLPTWHRCWELLRRLQGVERLAPYDVAAPLGSEQPVFSYEQCVEWICASLEPLGDGYVDVVRRGCLDDRWVDALPTVGKVGGAFSAGSPGMAPFIVMSFDGTAISLGTLAHELGHSMHSYLTWQNQPQVYTRYATFAAEVASNFNQAMLRDHLLRTVDDPVVQRAVLAEALANFHRYFFVMPTLARLERELHDRVQHGEGLTAEWIGERTFDLFAEAFGPDVELDRDRVAITWAQFPHLYAPFYVFQYATGIAAATALARGVIEGAPGAVGRYLAFLSAGSSVDPIDALAEAGVDMRSPTPVNDAFAVLAALVDRIESFV